MKHRLVSSQLSEIIRGTLVVITFLVGCSTSVFCQVLEDTDGDGIVDTDDNCPEIQNPLQENNEGDPEGDACDADDDNDGIADTEDEFPFTAPIWLPGDSDGDGLLDGDEANLGTDPDSPDSDDDGLDDGTEIVLGSDPLIFDTDNDGLRDGIEADLHSSPLFVDTDSDGLPDGQEVIVCNTNPVDPDTDLDGILDGADECPLIIQNDTIYKIANCCGGTINPAGSHIPHEHSFGLHSPQFPAGTPLGHPGGTVRRGGVAAAASPDTVPAGDHQHRDQDAWVAALPNRALRWRYGRDEASGGAVLSWAWDNKSLRTRRAPGAAGGRMTQAFDSGHAFIDELGFGYQPQNPNHVCYRFGTAAGANVPPAVAQGVVNNAFGQWSAISAGAGVRNLVTGLEFRRVGVAGSNCPGGTAEIQVLWRNIASNASTGPAGGGLMQITFDCDPTTGRAGQPPAGACPAVIPVWNFGMAAGVGGGQLHFLSTALHEIGHVVGLDHTAQTAGPLGPFPAVVFQGLSGIMRPTQPTGCPAFVCRNTIDSWNSVHGARDMYSIPTPDFGDAPDNSANPADFPTLLASNGARAPTLAFEWLGPRETGNSTTTREPEARVIDRDEFDNGCEVRTLGEDLLLVYRVSVNDATSARYADDPDQDDLFVAAWSDVNQNHQWTPAAANPGELLLVHGVDPERWPSTDVTVHHGPAPQIIISDQHFIAVATKFPPGTFDGSWLRCRLVYGIPTVAPAYLMSDRGDEGLVPLANESGALPAGGATTDCGDGMDNDGDGDTDAADAECFPDNGGEIEDYPPHFEEIHIIRVGEAADTGPVDTSPFGGTPPYTFTVVPRGTVTENGITNDDLPEGLVIDPATGALSGSPEATEEVFHVLCAVFDSEGRLVAFLWWIIIIDDGSIPHFQELHVLPVGAPVDTGPVATEELGIGRGTFSFFAGEAGVVIDDRVSSALPDGLLIDRDTGSLSGLLEDATRAFDVLCIVVERATWEPVAYLWWTIIPLLEADEVDLAELKVTHVAIPPGGLGNPNPLEWAYRYRVTNTGAAAFPGLPSPFLIFSAEQDPSHIFHDELVTVTPAGSLYQKDFLWSGTPLAPLPAFSDENYTWIGLQAPGPILPGASVEMAFTDPHPPIAARAALALGPSGPLAANFRLVDPVYVPHIPHFTEIHHILRWADVDAGPVDTSPFGGTPPYSFRALPAGTQTIDGNTNEDLPPGLELDEGTGRVTGVTAAVGEVYVLCEVIDANGEVVAHLWWIFRIQVKVPAMSVLGLVALALLLLAAMAGAIRRRSQVLR